MSGHSKWSNIKHKKAKEDARRSRVFSKLTREITVAARLGGSTKEANPRLRSAILTALSKNMTKDMIEKAIGKSIRNSCNVHLEETCYEGYGASGTAFIVNCMTDNRNRTVAQLRQIFTKFGGNLGTSGSVSYMFKKKGIIEIKSNFNENLLTETVLELSTSEDILHLSDGMTIIITHPSGLWKTSHVLESKGIKVNSAKITIEPIIKNNINSIFSAEKVKNMISSLEELEDVQNVYTNAVFIDT